MSTSTVKATSTRYRAFTKTVLNLVEKEVQFQNIEGNDAILVSTVALEHRQSCIAEKGRIVFHMPILTDIPKQRFVIVSRVPGLSSLVKGLSSCGVAVEHLYDY